MTSKTWLSLSVLVVIGVVCALVIHSTPQASVPTIPANGGDQVVCTMEAKMCPDGSYVGRSGPKCEFTACPTSAAPTTSSTKAQSGTSKATTSTNPNANVPAGVTGTPGTATYTSGVNGVVTLNGHAYPTMVAVFRAPDMTHAIAFRQTDDNAIYSFALAPGTYILGAGESNSPQCDHPQITVGTASYVTANIACK